jgi:hypothetical protein
MCEICSVFAKRREKIERIKGAIVLLQESLDSLPFSNVTSTFSGGKHARPGQCGGKNSILIAKTFNSLAFAIADLNSELENMEEVQSGF